MLAAGGTVKNGIRQGMRWTRRNLVTVLLAATFFLFISKSLYNIPVAIMAVLGLAHVLRGPGELLHDPLIRPFILLFMCIWIPMLIAFPDAVNHAHSARTVFPYLRYLFAGIYILAHRDRLKILGGVTLAASALITFWSVDAIIQFSVGYNLIGYPYQNGHITGLFYPRNTIAHVLAACFPFYLEFIRCHSERYKWTWLFAIALVVVVLISGRRAAWIMLFLGSAGYIHYLFRTGLAGPALKRQLAYTGMALILTAGLVIAFNDSLQDRIRVTAGLFSMDYKTVDIATARRLPIWETAAAVSRDHWINGIGPRGFRHVYTQYSDASDIWHETGTTNPHQMVLEILAETGVIGLTGFFCFLLLLWKQYRLNCGITATPYALPLLAVLFPLNTSMAFYGSYWSSVIWWLIFLFFLSCAGNIKDCPVPSASRDVLDI